MIEWTLEQGLLTISGTGEMEDYNQGFSPWYSQRDNIITVIITHGITSIGSYTFYDCNNLTSLTIPDSVTSIGQRAFAYCNNLTSLTIPDSVTSIGVLMFMGCASLKSIFLGTGITDLQSFDFYKCSNLYFISFSKNISQIATNVFADCKNLSMVEFVGTKTEWEQLTSNIDEGNEPLLNAKIRCTQDLEAKIHFNNKNSLIIGDNVFINNDRLINFYQKENTPFYSLGQGVFKGCVNLSSLILQEGLYSIGNQCFNSCKQLTHLTIPKSVKHIGNNCIEQCDNLETLEIPFIGTHYNNISEKFLSTVVPVTNKKIIVNITVGNLMVGENSNVYCIPYNAFTKTINNGVYTGVLELQEIIITDSIEQIQDYAFAGCTGLISCSLPNNNNLSFGTEVFKECNNLKNIEYRAIGNINDGEIILTQHNYVTGLSKNTATNQLNWNLIKCVNIEGVVQDVQENTNVFVPNPKVSEGVTFFESGMWYESGSIDNPVNPIGLATTGYLNYQKRILIDQKLDTDIKDTVSENSGKCGNNLTYQIISVNIGTMTKQCLWITGSGDMYNYTNDTFTPWNNKELYAVIIPNSITSIGDYCFANCVNLQYMDRQNIVTLTAFEEAIKSLSGSTFVNLGDKTNMPSLIKRIGKYAFYNSVSIKKIKLRDEVNESIGQRTQVDNYAFADMNKVEILEMGSGAKDLGDYSFRGLNINSLILDGGTIGVLAFENCTKLRKLSLVAYDNKTLSDTFGTDYILIEELTIVGGNIADRFCGGSGQKLSKLQKLIIDQDVTDIGKEAFQYCDYISEITWNTNSVSSMYDNDSFDSIGKVSQHVVVTFGDKVQQIPAQIFHCDRRNNHLSYIREVVFSGESVEDIGDSAFWHCYNLTNIVLPNSIKNIGHYAFLGCNALRKINIPINTTTIKSGAFENCLNLSKINWDAKNATLYQSFSSGNPYYIFQKTEGVYITVSFGEEVQTIPSSLFQHNSYLREVTMGNKITQIGDHVFSKSGLRAITIPDSVKNIGDDAFYDCALVSIKLPDNPAITRVPNFRNCGNLKSVIFGKYNNKLLYQGFRDCYSLNNVSLPHGMSAINDQAFSSCKSLQTINVPKSVAYVGENAFSNCDNLTTINYEGNQEEWQILYDNSKTKNNSNFFEASNINYNNYPDTSSIQLLSVDMEENSNDTIQINTFSSVKPMIMDAVSALQSIDSEVLYLLNGKEYAWKLYLYDNNYDVYITDNNTYSEVASYLPKIYAPTNSRVQLGQYITLQGENSYIISNIDNFNYKGKIFYRQSKGIIEGQLNYYGILSGNLKYDKSSKTYIITDEKFKSYLPTNINQAVNFSTGTKYDLSLKKGTIYRINDEIQVQLIEDVIPEVFEFETPIALEKAIITEASVSSELMNVVKPEAQFTIVGDNGLQTIQTVKDYYNISFTPGISINSSGYSSIKATMFDTDLILPEDILSTQVLIVMDTKGTITITGNLGEKVKKGVINSNLMQLIQITNNIENTTYFIMDGITYYINDMDIVTNTIYFSTNIQIEQGEGYSINRTDIFEHEIVLYNYKDIANGFDLADLHLTLNYINVFNIINIEEYTKSIVLSDTEKAYLITCDSIVEPTSYEVVERSLEKEASIERYSSILTVTTPNGIEPNHTLVDKNSIYYIYSNYIETPAYYFASVDKGTVALFINTNDLLVDTSFVPLQTNNPDMSYTINCSQVQIIGQYSGSIAYYTWDLQEWYPEINDFYSIYTEENLYTSNLNFQYNTLQHNSTYRLVLSIVTTKGLVVTENIYLTVNYMFNKLTLDNIFAFKDCDHKAIGIDFTNLTIHISKGIDEDNTENEIVYTPFATDYYNENHEDLYQDLKIHVLRQVVNRPDTACIIGTIVESDFKKDNILLTTNMVRQCYFYDYSFEREENYIYSVVPEIIGLKNFVSTTYCGMPNIITSKKGIRYNLKAIQLIDTEIDIKGIIDIKECNNVYKAINRPYSHWIFQYNTDAKNITINTDKTLFESNAIYATVGKSNRNYKSGSITALLGGFWTSDGSGDITSLTYRDSILLQNKLQEFANNGRVKLLRDEIGNILPVDITLKSCSYNSQAIPTNITINFEWTQIASEKHFGVYDIIHNTPHIVGSFNYSEPFEIFKNEDNPTYQELQIINSDLLELQVDSDNINNDVIGHFKIEVLAKVSSLNYNAVGLLADENYQVLASIGSSGLYKIDTTGYDKLLIKLVSIDNTIVNCYGKEVTYKLNE